MKNLFIILLITLICASCENDSDKIISDKNLSLSIEKADNVNTESRAIIEASHFNAGDKIGVWLKNENGNDYSPICNNTSFTLSGSGSSQKWVAGKDVILTSTKGKVIAFYPYDSSLQSYSSINIKSDSQTDYMYSGAVSGISKSQSTASLTMKHAMACIRLQLKRNTYTGTGNISRITVNGEGIGISGNLNAESGTISNVENGSISVEPGKSLNNESRNIDIMAVPTGKTSTVNCEITIDGKIYQYVSKAVALKSGEITIFQLNVNDPVISWEYTFEVNPWKGTSDYTGGSFTVTVTSYKTKYVNGNSTSETIPVSYSLDRWSCPSWISVSGNTMSWGRNSDTNSRNGDVYWEQDESGKRDHGTVEQSGYTPTVRYETSYEFSINPSSYTFGSSRDSYTFDVTCTRVVKTLYDGVVDNSKTTRTAFTDYRTEVSGTGFSCSGNTVTASSNSSTSSRDGTFTASYGGYSGSASLSQSGYTPTVRYETSYECSITSNPMTFEASGGSKSFDVTCTRVVKTLYDGVVDNSKTTRTAFTDYRTEVSGTGFSCSGNTVTATSNTSSSPRSGTFYVKVNGNTIGTASVRQKGKNGSVSVEG